MKLPKQDFAHVGLIPSYARRQAAIQHKNERAAKCWRCSTTRAGVVHLCHRWHQLFTWERSVSSVDVQPARPTCKGFIRKICMMWCETKKIQIEKDHITSAFTNFIHPFLWHTSCSEMLCTLLHSWKMHCTVWWAHVKVPSNSPNSAISWLKSVCNLDEQMQCDVNENVHHITSFTQNVM